MTRLPRVGQGKQYLLFISFFVLLGVLLSYADINLSKRDNTEIFLRSYDQKVFQGQDACFTYALVSDVKVPYTTDLEISLNGTQFAARETDISYNATRNETVCIPGNNLVEGGNPVKVSVGTLTLTFNVIKSAGPGNKTVFMLQDNPKETKGAPNPVFMAVSAFLVLLIPGFSIAHRFFKPRDLPESLALTFSFSALFVVLVSWALNFAGALGAWSILAAIIAISVALFRGKPALPKIEKAPALIMLAFVLGSVAVQVLFPSHDSIWSVYYERQAQAVYGAGGIPSGDALSYLGRPFTFVPGYMLLRSAYSWVSGADIQQAFFVFQVLGNLFFVSSVLLFSGRLKLSHKSTAVLLMFLYSSSFIFGWAIVSLLHLYAFSIFFVALALALERRAVSGVLAGLSGIFHASLLVGFPFVLLMLQKKTDLKAVARHSILGAAVFLVLYSYVLLNFGPPNEIQKDNWGYFIKGGIIDLGTNTAGFMSFAVLPALLYGLRKERRLVMAVVLLMLAFLFLSYRVNIFLSLLAGILFVKVFDSKEFLALFILFLGSIALNVQVYQGLIGAEISSPFSFLNGHAPEGARLLVEPLYGHTAAYLAKRPVLSDLYVEYASDEKYTDTISFIRDGDVRILEKWNISYVATLRSTRVLAVNNYNVSRKEIIYPGLDNIYDNGLFNVHVRRD